MTGQNRGRPPDAAPRSEHVQSLIRGLAVIRAFGADHPELTLSEVASATGLDRATARRFLLTLAHVGYVKVQGHHFSLTPRVLDLGFAYLSSLSLAEMAQPHLEELSAAVHESSSVSVLDGTDIVYVARVATSRIMRVAITVGTRLPAYATSMGRVLLAHMPEAEADTILQRTSLRALTNRTRASAHAIRAELGRVRAQGWAIVDQELEEGLLSVAVPIRNSDGEVVAAANLSTHGSRTSLETLQEQLLPNLLAAAARIEADIKVTAPSRA